jgi:hypothetical protein
MTWRRRLTLGVFVILWTPIVMFLGWGFVYLPLKFRYLINRVESARTELEERNAFVLAPRWGRVWELNWLKKSELPVDALRVQGDPILELEWLESSFWDGKPYRAYRKVISTNNLVFLHVDKKVQ